MKGLKRICTILTTIFISGCASQNIDDVYVENVKPSNGVVWGTMSYSGVYADYQLHFQNMDTEESIFISLNSNVNEDGVFAISLPEGVYRIVGWQVSSPFLSIYKKGEAHQSFVSSHQKLTYIGRVHFEQKAPKAGESPVITATLAEHFSIDASLLSNSYNYLDQQSRVFKAHMQYGEICAGCIERSIVTAAQSR
ncbi:hypothetical protein [Pseudoalteromonas luteoviolacea]|uniref:hypothetical protein n=1 Tax=Pseudoalteromonas luteoviolacea TaxID=43657 RepID=UPI001B37A888|nr:hypothetical protein [Pseudoalteromonas luteoviolacea]MBQ4834807.1 hypothetical protein [Pseudoalteromonas luteoviolacea]